MAKFIKAKLISSREKNSINMVTVFYSITQILQFDHLTGASRWRNSKPPIGHQQNPRGYGMASNDHLQS